MGLNKLSNNHFNIYYLVRELFATYNPTVNIVVEFPRTMDKLTYPTVAIQAPDLNLTPLQLGKGSWYNNFFYIDVFANNSIMRDEIASIIMDNITNNGRVIIDYSQRTVNGTLISNYPYIPPTSNTVNVNYDSSITVGYMGFKEVNSTVIDIDNIEGINLYRRNIGFIGEIAFDS